ncbi:MAG: transcription antitermination factor NusB [Sphingomonadales bacterium]
MNKAVFDPARKKRHGSRSAARLGAVQALYQASATGEGGDLVVDEFLRLRLGREIDGDLYKDADIAFFTDLVHGVLQRQAAVDRALTSALDANWPLDRLEAIIRAMLQAGTYELLARPDVPEKVVIDEYVDIAHAFYGGSEPGFVNGVLDRIVKKLARRQAGCPR